MPSRLTKHAKTLRKNATHAENKFRKRDQQLKDMGFKVLRFWNNEVIENTDEVLEYIRRICKG